MDFLLAGTLSSLIDGVQCRGLSSVAAPPAVRLLKTFRSKPNAIPPGDEDCSPFHRNRRSPSDRNAVRTHNGIVFGFTTESRSPSTGFPKIDGKTGWASWFATEHAVSLEEMQRKGALAKNGLRVRNRIA
jgi:hypothetical protein